MDQSWFVTPPHPPPPHFMQEVYAREEMHEVSDRTWEMDLDPFWERDLDIYNIQIHTIMC